MKRSMKKLMVFVMMAAITIFIAAATASAFDQQGEAIYGVYGWAGTGYCISTPNNFNPDGTPIVPDSLSSSSLTARGTITFKPDGTGMVRFKGVGINNPPFDFSGASLYEASYEHRYKIRHDRSITIDTVPNTYVQTFLTGPIAGVQLYIDFFGLKGWISAHQETITIATPEPRVNTNKFSVPWIPESYSICTFSFTLVRLSD